MGVSTWGQVMRMMLPLDDSMEWRLPDVGLHSAGHEGAAGSRLSGAADRRARL